MNYNKITIRDSGDFMNTPLDELFSLYCMQNLQMPPISTNSRTIPRSPAAFPTSSAAHCSACLTNVPLRTRSTHRTASGRASVPPCRSCISSRRRTSCIPVYYTKTAPALQHPAADALRARPFFLCRSRRISRILYKYDLKGIKPKILTVFRPYFALILIITQVENLPKSGYNNTCTKIIRRWRNIYGS